MLMNKGLACIFLAPAMAALMALVSCGSSGGGGGGSDTSPSFAGVPASMSEDGRLLLGGDTSQQHKVDGHEVEISVSDCTNGQTVTSCRINLTNLSPDHYLANARISTENCSDPAASFRNADYLDGLPLHGTTMNADGGVSAPVEGGGFCVVEDGNYRADSPYNPGGCAYYQGPQDTFKPYQTLSPDCGSISPLRWDFLNNGSGGFNFYIRITGEWFPEVPYGTDFLPGTADDDPRFDFQDRLTYLVMVTDLEDEMSAINKGWYRLGSYKRSNVLSGWNAIDSGHGSNNAVLSPGRYFAVNVAAEYPDRIESRNLADQSQFTNYEYYIQFSYILRYNPASVERISPGVNTPAGTYLKAGALDVCSSCDKGQETYRGYRDPTGLFSSFNDDAGYIMTYSPMVEENFQWMGTGSVYSTVSGNTVRDYNGGNIPLHMGHHGVARVNMTPVHGQSAHANSILSPDSAVIQEGADREPDMPIAMYYFKVKGGEGSEFRIDMLAGYSMPQLAFTNDTLAPGGWATGTDDWFNYCWPPTSGHLDNEDQGCDPAKPSSDYLIYAGTERDNPAITHSGFGMAGQGAYQAWNAHICIQ